MEDHQSEQSDNNAESDSDGQGSGWERLPGVRGVLPASLQKMVQETSNLRTVGCGFI